MLASEIRLWSDIGEILGQSEASFFAEAAWMECYLKKTFSLHV